MKYIKTKMNNEIIIGSLIVFIAGFFQGLTSFGFSLIAIPFLVIMFPLQETVPIIVILSICANICVIYNCIKEVKIGKMWLLILAGIIFVPFGSFALVYIDSNYLKLVFAIIVIVFSLLLFLNKSFPIKNEKIGYTLAGSLSGFLNGSLSLSGPPVVLFLSNQGVRKESFRANLSFYFIILNLIAIGTYLSNGLLSIIILEKTLYFIPAMLLGVFIGIKKAKKLNEVLFKKIALMLLIISGVLTVANTVISIIVD